MSELRAESIADEALSRRVLEIFGLVALILAVLGLYGVLSHSVAERSREIGIRIALGARAQSVLAAVLKEGLLLAGLGIVLGLVGSLLGARLLESLLYGVSSFDQWTLGMVAGVLLSVAVGSAALPAVRAVRALERIGAAALGVGARPVHRAGATGDALLSPKVPRRWGRVALVQRYAGAVPRYR